ncbi:MAG: CpsB/CapC family capsule biosynthesis tyrosine phosphatase [Bacteroidota bacterium]|nr:CpsB/CapC family capsule biosynthesis tyrosine phosphatase [Bacteroidota bacterium]MDP4215086.1 CpsB/CapC family capsule biosynthesis tyrosine phosphatase [Bacteroidota bacterium]MDP4244606.1 CpsB/CapC family capsule biosynthesis tyrosine phosphatase [Bacteroidota bacterium]MDP4253732.1 CpsB/CapC family capsule biosynthesis tyrosine phosphatase [Bacteroidota bacterium]MDP4258019.1 CpsB/CapC family capsule biosynthesis tyrosine phosphatase [Bacteroidota bacterium]
MFSLFNKKTKGRPNDLSGLGADLHSHLIPGIDDGVKTMDEALRMIRGLVDLGYKRIYTTPHILKDIYPNTPGIIAEGHRAVTAELARQQISVEFHAAAEYFMDDHFSDSLESGDVLLTLKGNMILVELSMVVAAINLKELLFKLQIKGYQPILAHPERYLYFGANKGWYDQIRDTGCLLQVNLLSMIGYYGKASQALAEYLIKKKYVDLLGTDLHHERHLNALTYSSRLQGMVDKLLDSGTIRNPQL